ncbi:cutinase family protein [Amycolatopsis azurea]|uniref:cutinase family protein n=1 Tax=Amycolatopsis azurea TaxID=36819 RepID=UPI003800EE7D
MSLARHWKPIALAAVMAGLLTGPVTSASAAAASVSDCTDVYVLAARGSGESPGTGAIGSLAAQIKKQSGQSVEVDAVDYPAQLAPYGSSSAKGTAAVKKQLADQAATCPDQKIVLIGYSQGAHIIGDALGGGGGGTLGTKTPPIDAGLGKHVAAVIQMGDPRHIPGQSFDKGTSQRAGMFPRQADQLLTGYANRIRAYCDTRDLFCDSGSSLIVHGGYLARYTTPAVQFVLDTIGG